MDLNLLIVIGLTTAVLSVGLYVWVSSRLHARKTRKRFQQGIRAEQTAHEFLENHGFTILATQPSVQATMWLDDQAQTYTVRADYLVKRRGRKSLVEVKNGNVANPRLRHTRRQLFEYLHLYRVQRLYLFDAQQSKLIRIRFSKPSACARGKTILYFGLGALCARLMITLWA